MPSIPIDPHRPHLAALGHSRRAGIAIVTALVVLGGARRAHGEPESVVVTGTRTPETAQRATVRTDVVTREEAERRGATNVAEALASQAGVQVNPGA